MVISRKPSNCRTETFKIQCSKIKMLVYIELLHFEVEFIKRKLLLNSSQRLFMGIVNVFLSC